VSIIWLLYRKKISFCVTWETEYQVWNDWSWTNNFSFILEELFV